jgi:hypothetical protein
MFLQESSTVKWNSCDAKVRFCYFNQVPRKIRQLVSDLRGAGFFQVPGGEGSHRKFRHEAYRGFVLISDVTVTMRTLIRSNRFEEL